MPIVVNFGAKQYTVVPGQKIIVDRLKNEVGDKISIDPIFAYGEEKDVKKLEVEVLEHQKGKKIRVVKYKSKSNYHRQYGYRHFETIILISLASGNKKAKTDSNEKESVVDPIIKSEETLPKKVTTKKSSETKKTTKAQKLE
jgi:large subunit ribosomal protein L21